jgi:hypothetical protein
VKEFICGVDLWANIVGGVVAAGLIALAVYLRDRRKHRILRELTVLMGRAILHRNIGERGEFTDAAEWARQAEEIEKEAVAKANELSSTAGSLVDWLDRVEPYEPTSEVEKYKSILNKVIERIRGLLERNS